MKRYTLADRGCWADGAFGHEHLRAVLSGMVADLGNADLASELEGWPSDDMSEEDEALALLQEYTDEGLSWAFQDGDLILYSGFED